MKYWRDDSVVESKRCSCKGPRFLRFLGYLQLPIIQVLGYSMHPSGLSGHLYAFGAQKLMQAHTHRQQENKSYFKESRPVIAALFVTARN